MPQHFLSCLQYCFFANWSALCLLKMLLVPHLEAAFLSLQLLLAAGEDMPVAPPGVALWHPVETTNVHRVEWLEPAKLLQQQHAIVSPCIEMPPWITDFEAYSRMSDASAGPAEPH